MTEQILKGVLYTDGGCRSLDPKGSASRGFAGWGIHGYIYTDEVPKVGAGARKGVPSTKGYDLNAKGKGEITVVKYVDGFAAIPGESTNNVAELVGATEAIKLAEAEGLKELTVLTDSKYVVDGSSQHLPKWKANQWLKSDRTPVQNLNEWKAFDEAMTRYVELGNKVAFQWVKGHNGDPGNTLADRYATRGVYTNQWGRPIVSMKVVEAKGYWKAEFQPHRMLNLPAWYFTTNGDMERRTRDGKAIYYLGDIRDKIEFTGKRISDATLAVVYLKEPESVMEKLHAHFEELAKGTVQGLVVSHLKALFHRDIYDALMNHGDDLLMMSRREQRVYHVDCINPKEDERTLLAEEIRPTRLSYNLVNVLESLEVVLNAFLEPKEGSKVTMTDITEVLYEKIVSGKKTEVKLKSQLQPGTRAVHVPANIPQGGTKTLCLTFAQDLPDRNTLAALASEEIKAYIVTFPVSPVAFRFATIIQSGEDVGLWSGPYANLQLISAG